jgi:flavin-dependent dehydrogenase
LSFLDFFVFFVVADFWEQWIMALQYDAVVVGAGYAGLTAAIGLARNGFAVAVVEAAQTVGEGGTLGGVCFAENLIQPDILGPAGMESLAWERRLVERGSFASDGRRLAGYIYRDADAFRPCYLVSRRRFLQHLAAAASAYGVVLQTETTVESLIREGRRIIGAATTHGPLYAPLVFLAEGGAGHLVSREGLDRSKSSAHNPAFLYCLQQVIELPSGTVESCFRLGNDQGVAYDLLLRNPDRTQWNARAMLCSNRQGLTLSVIVPIENLQRGFGGEPRQLLDWLADMPALRPWLGQGQRGAWTAALLRTGGMRDVPYLVEDGLVVGGAAAGLSVDFPILNWTGPATATGLLLSRAAVHIRNEGRSFDRAALMRHYLEPLQQTRYWSDAAFLQRWPTFLRKSHVFFDFGLDLTLDSFAAWARPRRWLPWKFLAWLGVLARVSWRQWNELRDDVIHLGRALRLREATPRPALARLLLDGALNAFRDLARRPRPHLPPSGALRLHYRSADEEGRASAVPWLFRRWFERFRPVLAAAARSLLDNGDMPLSAKLERTIDMLLRQINLFDLVAVAALAFPSALIGSALAVWFRIFHRIRRRTVKDAAKIAFSTSNEDRTISPCTTPLIHIVWRSTQPQQQAASVQGLEKVCPSGVFEVLGAAPETVQVVVRSERCIFCEACWRTNPLVDWGRRGASLPLSSTAATDDLAPRELATLFDQLEHKLHEFDAALMEGPDVVDRQHNDYLEMLARYAHQITLRIREMLNDNAAAPSSVRDLAEDLVSRAEERTRRTWEGRLAWAAADGRLMRQHHLVQLRRLLALTPQFEDAARPNPILPDDWLPVAVESHSADACAKHAIADIAARRYLLDSLEEGDTSMEQPLRAELLSALREDVRHGLSARTAELKSLLGEYADPLHPNKPPFAAPAYRRHGRRLILDLHQTRKLLDVAADWRTLAQRPALRIEREELLEAEKRLLALANDWRGAQREPDDEVSGGFGRQAAHILAGKILLLRTFARVQKGEDSERAIMMLRVWLDYASTLLDEFAIALRGQLRSSVGRGDRPFVEPDSPAPLRTQAEYLDSPARYTCGDFLLAPVDLLQPRLVPEMVGEKDIVVAGPSAAVLLRLLKSSPPAAPASGPDRSPTLAALFSYLAETTAVETIGRCAADPSAFFDLEWASSRMILAEHRQSLCTLRDRCVILRALCDVVMPRGLAGGMDARARHLERDAVELEALKAEFRQRMRAAWQAFGQALGRNADVQASCFALAEAAAWLKAADSALGRLAWISRHCQAEDCEEPSSQQDLGRRALAHCFAEIRDRLFRFDEDLASLRRGYYAPHVYAAALPLRRAESVRER